jgi:hypothetical protein
MPSTCVPVDAGRVARMGVEIMPGMPRRKMN